MGVYFYMYTGGESLWCGKQISSVCAKNNDCEFHAFTNGTLVDEDFCKGNAAGRQPVLSISLEGFEEVNDLRRGGIFDRVWRPWIC